MGEALSVLVMDTSIGIEMPTLARIPEGTKLTADFRASSLRGEPIVFESKGSTDWKTHRGQRQKALKQLGKGERITESAVDLEPGRAFACCLFASRQGEERSSVLSVEDPPFRFRSLFQEGWETRARREHFAAVLEFAGQMEAARAFRRGEGVSESSPSNLEGEASFFHFGDALKERSIAQAFDGRVVGTWDDLETLARRARIPAGKALAGVRLFRGLDAPLYRELSSGRLPEVSFPPASTGWLSLEKGSAQGVYSRLANGSVLAVQVD